ncbi:hypothetical protein PIB30_035146, partial [Stylosanthes scabra]|nr:hypothetical protein [Stylosanthes scabra]
RNHEETEEEEENRVIEAWTKLTELTIEENLSRLGLASPSPKRDPQLLKESFTKIHVTCSLFKEEKSRPRLHKATHV